MLRVLDSRGCPDRAYICATPRCQIAVENFFPARAWMSGDLGFCVGSSATLCEKEGVTASSKVPDSSRKTGAFILPARAYFGDLVNFDRRSATLCEKSPHTLDFMDSSSGDVRHNGDGRIPICGSMGSHPLGFVWLNNLCAGVHLYLAVVGHSGAAKITLGAVFYAMALRFARKANFYVRDALSRVNSYAPPSQFSGYFWPFVEFGRNGVELWYPLVKDSTLPFF